MTPGDLVDELESAGDVPAGFGPLLEKVPREWFIPERIWVDREPIDRAVEADRWGRAVYGDNSVVTQFDDGRARWPEAGMIPTCSSSMPSVVLGMLGALGVEPGDRVLELGTGTGWNAALLAELVGESGRVVSVEIDQGLARAARRRLTAAGYEQVKVVVGDGERGLARDAPYDRVVATMSVHLGRVPYAWVEQTRPGGVIVTPVRAELASGPLVAFTVREDGTATGRTLPMGVGFMESRSQRTPAVDDDIGREWEGDVERVTRIRPGPLLEAPSPRWALAVAIPSCRYDVEATGAWLRDPVSGSWASVVPQGDETHMVRQAGARRLWDEAEAAHRWWHGVGRPHITDWRWTITRDRQTVSPPAR